MRKADTILVDAEQELAAQREHGHLTHVLGHKIKQAQLLDVELGIEERRALLRGQRLGPDEELSGDRHDTFRRT